MALAQAQQSSSPEERFRALVATSPVVLAPMEEVTTSLFRGICRELGARLCLTEFVNAEGLLRKCKKARRKITLADDDQPTGVQIYGNDAARLAAAAQCIEAASAPPFIDINCGCPVHKVARRGAGAGWLRDPEAMVDMVAGVVRSVSLPVTVKTRLGLGTEAELPIVGLAKRLEDIGIAGLTIHCRTAQAGLGGKADWSWAARIRDELRIPLIVNGDVSSADDAARALAATGCEGVMIGRRAIDHPWVFGEAYAWLERRERQPPPTVAERLRLSREHLKANVRRRPEPWGVRMTRRHLAGYLRGMPGAAALRRSLFSCDSLAGCLALLDDAAARWLPMESPRQRHDHELTGDEAAYRT